MGLFWEENWEFLKKERGFKRGTQREREELGAFRSIVVFMGKKKKGSSSLSFEVERMGRKLGERKILCRGRLGRKPNKSSIS